MLGARKLAQRLEPVTGKAVEVRAGETLAITTPQGEQCVDFNAFNLHDYKEYMSVGHSRRQGMHLIEGDTLLTNTPRCNALLHIARMPETCVGDTLAARCNAVLFEWRLDFEFHTNCQDTLAEAIREYGLTPDDVHDSFNIFMDTRWDAWSDGGTFWSALNGSRPGDEVHLVACMDTLAVPIVCGSGDIGPVSSYGFKPIDIAVHEATDASRSLVESVNTAFAAPKTRVGPEDYRVPHIRTERELAPDPDYEPAYLRHPLTMTDVEVPLSEALSAALTQMIEQGRARDMDDAIRKSVMPELVSRLSVDSPERVNDAERRRLSAQRASR